MGGWSKRRPNVGILLQMSELGYMGGWSEQVDHYLTYFDFFVPEVVIFFSPAAGHWIFRACGAQIQKKNLACGGPKPKISRSERESLAMGYISRQSFGLG